MNQVVTNDLQKVGNRGLYQTLLGVVLFFINAEANMLIFGATFIYMNPTFRCDFVEGNVDESIACPRINQCTITSDFTIVATSGLYCDRQFQRNIIQSAFAVGAFFGLFLVMYISDLNGRRFGLILAQIIGILSVSLTILGGHTQSIPILALSQFVSGFAAQAMSLLVYVLPSQYCEDNLRQNMIVVINYAWAITTIMIGVLYYTYNWWYNYLLVFVLLPFIVIFFITYFFLVQSPYFLHQEGLWDRYHDSLRTIAMYNNTTYLDRNTSLAVQEVQQQIHTEQEEAPFLDVICDPYYLKIILYLILAEIGICIYYFGANYSLDLIGKDYGFNCILTGGIQFVAYIFLQFIVTRLPRRYGLIVSCSIMAALGFIFLIPSLVPSLTAQLIIIGLNRFIGTFVYTVLIMYVTELFPTKVEGTCLGIIESGAQVGNFLAPIMVSICINNQIYPLVFFSIVIVLMIVIPLSLVDDSRLTQEKMKEIQEQKKN